MRTGRQKKIPSAGGNDEEKEKQSVNRLSELTDGGRGGGRGEEVKGISATGRPNLSPVHLEP